MKQLVQDLVRMRVRPYYIYQCDLSLGLEHFRTPVSKGIEIIEGLRGHTSGYAVPTFVVDAPGGGGMPIILGGIGIIGSVCVSGCPNHLMDQTIVSKGMRRLLAVKTQQ